jgi:hypothetical protein
MEEIAPPDAHLSGPGMIRAAVTGMSREQMIARPIAGRWSVLEVVCHLVDTDANIAHRIKRVLSEERPVFDRVKPGLMLAALAYHDRDVGDELGIFDLTRRQIGRILRASRPEACERPGVVRDRGDRTVGQMINGAVEHLAHHLGFVLETRRALGIDSMLCRASRRLDVGPTSLDGSPADREVARSGPTTPKSIDPRDVR